MYIQLFGKSAKFSFIFAGLLLVGAGCSSATAPREQSSAPQAVAPSTAPVAQPQAVAETALAPAPAPAPEPAPAAPTDPNQPTKDWTVLDYFYHIPAKYVTREEDRRTALTRESIGYQERVIDKKNYYLLIPGNGEYYTTVAVFVKSDGGGIVGVDNRGCGPLCQQNLYFLDYRNGAWVDITAQVLPPSAVVQTRLAEKQKEEQVDPDAPSNPLWTLPQYGTSIIYQDKFSDISVYEVKWNGSAFIKKAL